jgi:hypothetical protein
MTVSDKPFDPVKACFYLIAGILAFQCLVVLIAVVWCLFYATPEILAGKFQCDKDGRIAELLSGALAAALAFSAGRIKKD